MLDQAVSAECLVPGLIVDPVHRPHVGIAVVYPLLNGLDSIREIGANVVDGLRQCVRHDRLKVGNVRSGVLEVAPSLAL